MTVTLAESHTATDTKQRQLKNRTTATGRTDGKGKEDAEKKRVRKCEGPFFSSSKFIILSLSRG